MRQRPEKWRDFIAAAAAFMIARAIS